MVCIGNYGHMTHIQQLSKVLVARGHDVHVITVGNERKEKIEKMFESIPGVTLIFTEGPSDEVLKIHLEMNDKWQVGSE